PMVRWLREQGLEAGAFATQYGDDTVEADALGADEAAPPTRAESVENAEHGETQPHEASDTASRS
ncbi:hypothetical protein QMN58_27125, partial [Escherichia coli]|nr:hypothetical protein [Escherichia coli]